MLPPLAPDRRYRFRCRDGLEICGTVSDVVDGWCGVEDNAEPMWLQIAQIVAVTVESQALPAPVNAAGGKRKRTDQRASGAADGKRGRDWQPQEVRELAEGFLDGATDSDLASHFGCPRGAINSMRQAFECARGNLVEEEIDGLARSWVDRVRSALSER
jgi:hypothetical protein